VTGSPYVFEQLGLYGPWLILVMTAAETSFITGLVVPAGFATSAATIMAVEGTLSLEAVVIAALAGGFIGDTIGFWIGSVFGERILTGDGRWSRAVRARTVETDEMLGRHPLVSVTVARLISFVRTVMPLMAGMSGMRYRYFLPYELVGLVLWAAIYVSIGLAGREGWELATGVFGAAGTLAFLAGTALFVVVLRRRRARSARRRR
jgi:undecaprenyl-diphosphatase